MIQTSDGTTVKRTGGSIGDRAPALGFNRLSAVYTAVGSEVTIDLSSLVPAITYQPGKEQLKVLRSSQPGEQWAGRDYSELSATKIQFNSGALLPGEEVKIIREFEVVGVQATTPRPDAYGSSAVAGQTLIAASFSWPYNLNPTNPVGAISVFLNGILQTRGQDFTEVNLGGAFTNQILLTDPLIGGENIIVLPTYQVVDQSSGTSTFLGQQIEGIQKLLTSGTQAFVDETELIQVPSTSVANRAKIPNLANNLKASFGVDRFHTQLLVEMFGESGPSGERVFTCVGDYNNQVRFVGNGWRNGDFNFGNYVQGSNVGEWLEYTFFGTGLNLLCLFDSSSDFRAAVDSDTYGANLLPPGKSTIITNRTFSAYEIIPVVKDLSLGIHTVKIKRFNSSGFFLNVHGFETLNQSTTISVNPGTGFSLGQKYSAITSFASALKTGFDNVLDANVGTRGGRAVIYLKPDGTVAKLFTATDSTQKNFSAADHSNEEVIRKYNYREFGSGRVDDWSTINTAVASNRAFTLDDNSTTMIGQGVVGGSTGGIGTNGSGDFLTIVFTGTGLDIIQEELPVNFSGTHQILIDGNVTFSGNLGTIINKGVWKVVSGLPYGTHTFRFIKTSAGSGISFHNFLVYGPKKPTIPSNSIELADYFVLADFDGSSTNGTAISDNLKFPTGVISKFETREFIYTGTGWSISLFPTTASGYDVSSPTTGDSVYYTFFGTGFQFHGYASGGGGTYDVTVTIDGVANASGAVRGNATAIGGGVYRSTSTTYPQPYRIDFTALPLGVHTVRIQKTAGVGNFNPGAFHIITPIHAPKYQTAIQQVGQNIGNCSLSDSRKTSLSKDTPQEKRGWAQVVGVTPSPTVSSLSYVPMPEMIIPFRANGKRPVRIDFGASLYDATASNNVQISIFVNGEQRSINFWSDPTVAGQPYHTQGHVIVMLPEGVHEIQGMWRCGGGTTITSVGTERLMTAYEIT